MTRREVAADRAAAQLLQEEAAAGAAKGRAQAKKARQKQRKQARLLRLDLGTCLACGQAEPAWRVQRQAAACAEAAAAPQLADSTLLAAAESRDVPAAEQEDKGVPDAPAGAEPCRPRAPAGSTSPQTALAPAGDPGHLACAERGSSSPGLVLGHAAGPLPAAPAGLLACQAAASVQAWGAAADRAGPSDPQAAGSSTAASGHVQRSRGRRRKGSVQVPASAPEPSTPQLQADRPGARSAAAQPAPAARPASAQAGAQPLRPASDSQPAFLAECVVCLDAAVGVCLVPCGHLCVCSACAACLCARQPALCPLCCCMITSSVLLPD